MPVGSSTISLAAADRLQRQVEHLRATVRNDVRMRLEGAVE
jgi:hypothetical protein